MHEILPGIFDASWEEIEKKIKQAQSFAGKIHIDLVDESFAPQKNFFDPTPFTPYTKDIFFELHMMVKEPEAYLEEWSRAGFRRFIGHVEHMTDQVGFVAKAQEFGEVGLALDIDTEIDQINVSMEDLDTVLVMMCKAGASGQAFQPKALDKVRALREKTDFLRIEVDGGISDRTIKEAFSAGATRFVSTSFIFWNNNDPKARHQALTDIIGAL